LNDPYPQRFVGTYHLASSGRTSWHGFADAIIRAMPVDGKQCTQVDPIPSSEYPLPSPRPKNSVLNCDKLEATFGLHLPLWDVGLSLVLEEYAS